MKTLCKIIALLGLAGVAYAGPSGPPAGSYILNVSTSVSTPAFKVSSGTVSTQLKLNYGTKGNLIWLDTNGIVTTTTTIPAGGDVVKASTQTLTGFNTFAGSTTLKSQVVIQTTNSGSSQGSGGALFINATNESGMPVQVYSSSANAQAFLSLINSSTGYANSYIYVNGASSTTGKADAYLTDPNPNIQFVETGVVSPAGQYEFMVVADTFQLRSMNAGGSAYKPRIGMTHPGSLCFYETNDNGHFVCFSASNTIASNVNWTLPASDTSGCFQSDGAGHITLAPCSATGIVSPGTFTWTNTGFGVNVGTATLGSASSTALGNNPWVSINSSGTSQALTITNYGQPSGAVQNQSGVLNIVNPLGTNPSAALVIVDSVTDSQVGSGVFEIWSNNPLHNDPLFWIHRTSSNSSPEMRWDSPSPNMEVVNTSTDNTKGYGKWEPFAIASHGVDLQVNNRAYSNGTFETLAFWHPLSKFDLMPGLYLNAQNVTDDGGASVSSDTTGAFFQTLNAHTVGITAPQSSQFSWIMGLPILPKANGVLLYNAGNRGGNFSVRQSTWTDTDFTYATTTGVKVSSLTLTGQITFPGQTTDCSAAGNALTWASATGKVGCNTIAASGGGASTLAVTTGSASGFTGAAISSPAVLNFDQNYFSVLSAAATAFTTITPLFADTNTWTGQQIVSQPNSGTAGIAAVAPSPGGGNAAYLMELDAASAGIAEGYLGYTASAAGVPGGLSLFNNSKVETARFATNSGGVWIDDPGGLSIKNTPSTTNLAPAYGEYIQTGLVVSTISASAFNATVTSVTVTGTSGLTVSTNTTLGTATYYQNGVIAGASMNTNELTGTLQAGQFPALTGDVTTTAGSLATTAAGTQANITNFSSALTMASSVTINGSLRISTLTLTGPTYNQDYNTITNTNYVITSTDSLVLCNAVSNAVTLTLPSASASNGQILTIQKTDLSASSCTIKASGSDQIVSTGTWFLFAQAQEVVIQSTGGTNLWARAGPMETPEAYIGGTIAANVAETVATSSNVYCTWYGVSRPSRVTGMRFSASTANGTMDVAIIDSNGNRLASSGLTAMPGTGNQTLTFTAAVNILPGTYGLCAQISNVTGALRGLGNVLNGGFLNTESSGGIPATLTVPGTASAIGMALEGIVTGGGP